MAPQGKQLTLAGILQHPRFSTVMSLSFLLLSGIMVFFNVYLQHWGIGTFDSVSRWVELRGEAGYYDSTPFCDARGKPSILDYARSPAGRFMHILPAGLWSVIAPLQLSPTFRARHRTAHRRLGRLFIFMSASIAFGVVPLIVSGASIFPRSVLIDGLFFAFSAYFLGTGLLAVRYARGQRFSDHRVWILRHVAMGYSVHLQRLLAFPTYWIFPYVLPGYTDHSPKGALLRGGSLLTYFYLSVALSVGSMELWLRHTTPGGVAPGKKAQDKVATTKAT